jgi:hypothetical protein
MKKPMRTNSRESASLLNPAFLALLAYRAVEGYETASSKPMPFILPYLCVPASLHPDVRTHLTYNKTTNLMSWVETYPDMRLAIRQASIGLEPYVAEALSFALAYKVLRISQGAFELGNEGPTKVIKFETQEVHDCQRAAKYLGRWFADSGPASHISAAIGVKP